MSNIFKDYKCPICNGILTIQTKKENCGHFSLRNPRLVCNHCKIRGGFAGVMFTEEEERERLIYYFEKTVASRKANDLRKPEKILTDIRDYLVKMQKCLAIESRMCPKIRETALVLSMIEELHKYAEKLGVEL